MIDDMSCQYFCTVLSVWELFPSHIIILLWECYYILWTANPSSSLSSFITCTWAVVHLRKQYMVLKIVVNWFQGAGKARHYFSFYCAYIHLQAMQNPGKLIDEEGHQFHVSADTCTCKPVVKKISSQDHTPCQWVFGTTFTGTTFLETGT